jgi:HSP20 family protein
MPDDMIRLMHAFFLPAGSCEGPHWCPAADVYRASDGWLVKLDLAGIRPQDIEVEVRGRRLLVRGTRRDWSREEGHRHYRMEIAYSHFERSLELPCDLERANIKTDYRDGMLFVQIIPASNDTSAGGEGRK